MDVQHYTIRGKGSNAEFFCSDCDYHVRIKGFDPSNGNVRTQAATAMAMHLASEHKYGVATWAVPFASERERMAARCRKP
jgi:hypothetical protein